MTNHILNISLGEMQALSLELISFCLRSKFLYEHLLEKQKDRDGMWSFFFDSNEELDTFLAKETPNHEKFFHFQPWIRPLCHIHYVSTLPPDLDRVEVEKPNYPAVEQLLKQTRWISSKSELFFPKELRSTKKREQKNTLLFFQICVRAKLDTLYDEKFVFFEQHFMWEKTKENYFHHVFPFSCYVDTYWVKEKNVPYFSFGSFKLKNRKVNKEKTKKNETIEKNFNQSLCKRFLLNKIQI